MDFFPKTVVSRFINKRVIANNSIFLNDEKQGTSHLPI